MQGNIFTNQIANGIADSAAGGCAYFIVKALNIKRGYLAAYAVCTLSCLLLMISVMSGFTSIVPVLVLTAKFSIAVAYCFLYFTTVSFFETEYLGLMMGAMNFAGRLSTIPAPMIAE